MEPLLVLLGTFAISLIATRYFTKSFNYPLSGRIAMSVMLVFTAIAHFAFTKGMAMMIPDFLPFKTAIIYITGIVEIIAAICLLIRASRVSTGWGLILFFILLLPGNINAAIHHINYQKGTFDGHGPEYLWFRVPLQIFFIIWTYVWAIRFNTN